MSNIRVDNFGPSAGGTLFSTRGIAKSWVSFDGTGPTINDDENVSSLTDNGNGDYRVNLTNNHSTGDYEVQFTSTDSTAASAENAAGILASSYIIRTLDLSGTPVDRDYAGASSKGDLA